ncbi:MAG: phosphate acyltransferase PlsX [Aquificota bacterium]|nr:MAG: phosphate acyltransferase PlsX [Aquificota bacterium]
MRIAVDAMGGDYAPREVIKGALEAVSKCPCEVILVGDKEIIQSELDKLGGSQRLPLLIKDAPEVIGMSEHPAMALRRKRNSSIKKAVELVKRGKARAVVSAGNTGAVMVAAKLLLGTLEGVSRPGIAVTLPARHGPFLLIDAGANVGSRPENLLEFAIMGHLYSKYIMGCDNPRVGLLSIGEEEVKGDGLMRTSFQLLRKATQLNFVGNVEAKEIFNNQADVVVCDGLVGNLALKVGESAVSLMGYYLKGEFSKGLRGKLAYFLFKPSLERIKRRTDYEEYGGAPLLGVNGICIICHGSSNAHAIANAIKVACDFAEKRLNKRIKADLEAVKESLGLGRKFWPSFRDWRDAFRIRGERIEGDEALAGASKEEGEEE